MRPFADLDMRIKLRLTIEQYELLIFTLGVACGSALRDTNTALAQAINDLAIDMRIQRGANDDTETEDVQPH